MLRRSNLALAVWGWSIGLVLLVAVAQFSTAAAEQLTSLYHPWEINGSLTSAILNTNIRVDSERLGRGTEFDAEDDLGLDKSALEPRASFRWRPGRKHELEGGFQFAERGAEKILERTIEVGDTTFDAGAAIHTTLNTNVAYLNYRYAIWANERNQIGPTIGIGTIFLGVGLDALASMDDQSVSYSSESSVLAPFGSLGVYGRILSGERWQFEADVRYLKASIDRYTARVADGGAAARYFLSPKWGLEGGWGVSAIKVDIDPKESGAAKFVSGQIKYSLQNVRLGVVFVP
jgi:hypothetical protein